MQGWEVEKWVALTATGQDLEVTCRPERELLCLLCCGCPLKAPLTETGME